MSKVILPCGTPLILVSHEYWFTREPDDSLGTRYWILTVFNKRMLAAQRGLHIDEDFFVLEHHENHVLNGAKYKFYEMPLKLQELLDSAQE